MDSEKAMYWMAVGVLALAVTNGLMTGYNGWAGRLADKSIALAERASEIGSGYLNASFLNVATPDRGYGDLQRVAQVDMACVRSTLARHSAEIARAQAQAMRAQMVQHRVHAIVQSSTFEVCC